MSSRVYLIGKLNHNITFVSIKKGIICIYKKIILQEIILLHNIYMHFFLCSSLNMYLDKNINV